MAPIFTNIAGSDQPAPVESTPVTPGQGDLAAISKGFQQAPSEIAAQAGLIGLAGGAHVSHDDAARQMTEQGYDASHVPAGGLTSDALHMIMNRQSILKRDDYAMARSGNGSVRQFVGQMVGGLPDPINAAAWVFAPEAKIGQTFAAKVAIGSAVQGGANLVTSLGTMPLAHTVGDDYTMSDVFTQTTLGVLLGGMHGFAKPGAVPARLTTDQVVALERSEAAAAAHNAKYPGAQLTADQVVSPAGAIGKHQVMPATAKGLGITGDLSNAETNRQASQALLDQLDKRYKGDPEAQAIAYNAGPKTADKWLKAGRDDSVLKPETKGYISRYREMTGRVEGAAPAIQEKPVVAYHGTDQDFAEYKPELGGKFGASDAKGVTFFTSRPEVAGGYADFASLGAARGEGTNIRPVSMQLENPKEIDWQGEMYSATKFKAAIAEAKAKGFDGVVFKNVQDDVSGQKLPSDIYAVFDANKNTKPYFGPHPVHDLPPQVQPDLLKTAIAQAGDDSKVNVEPVLKQSVAEMYGVKNPSDFDPRGAAEAIPQPGSAEHAQTTVPEPALPESLKRAGFRGANVPAAAAEKGPLTTEAQKSLDAALAELKAVPEGIRKAGEPEAVAADNAIAHNEEIHKATEAAVQCGLTRGLG